MSQNIGSRIPKRLFLTGDMGVGKSTAILNAIGDGLPGYGGFLTRRVQGEEGLSFALRLPDGSREETFLAMSAQGPKVRMEVFETLGREALVGSALVLDEIGGIELLSSGFRHGLYALLERDVPILGVIKGEGPGGALIQALGLREEYETAAAQLRSHLRTDENTLVYECGRFDEEARRLAALWVKEYGP